MTVPTIIGVPVALPWAWASVDATRNGRSFRFATTHLDPISGVAQQTQADEFLAGPGSTTMPIVWVGDFNSDAEATVITGVPSATATYGSILASGYADAWSASHPSNPGFTCCQATDLLNPTSTLTERVDLVLTRGPFHVGKASLVGDDVVRPAAIRVVAIRPRRSRRDARTRQRRLVPMPSSQKVPIPVVRDSTRTDRSRVHGVAWRSRWSRPRS